MRRNRAAYAALTLVVIMAGLASRRYPQALPEILQKNAGDILWALMVFLLLALIWPRASTARLGAAALGISYLVEVSQLYHAPWIDAFRHTTLGALTLGWGFLWSDLVCYTIGVAIGVVSEVMFARGIRERPGVLQGEEA